MRAAILGLLSFLFLLNSAFATVWPSDGSTGSVQFLHDNSAVNGDTITLPPGTFLWTTRVAISKAITLQGAGVGQTIVRDGVQAGQLILWTMPAGFVSRMTGIEFRDGGRINVGAAPGGIVRVTGNNLDGSQFRFDHCKWDNLNGYLVAETVIGVIDHNTVLLGTKVGEWIYPYGSNWNGGNYGDASWSAPANFGSAQFLFLEDNTFSDSDTVYEGQLTDGFNGARFVVRHNTLISLVVGNHGTETPGRGRSCRAIEIYNNLLDCNNTNKFVTNDRGGTELVHDNTVQNCWGSLALSTLASNRMVGAFAPWGGADGVNGWDKNNAANPFFTGTISAVGNGTISVSGNPWTANQWTGFTIRRNTGGFSYIYSNTSNTLNISSGLFGEYPNYAVGDAFAINKIDQSLDQPGAGQSTLISAVESPTPPPGFTQATEPCYIWNNTNDGAPFNAFSTYTDNIRPGVHYFNNTPLPGYAPYTYPHPLVAGGAPTPTPTPTATATATATPTPTPTATATATATPTPTVAPSPTPTATPTPTPTPKCHGPGCHGHGH